MFGQSSAVNEINILNSEKYNFFYSFRPIYYFSRTFGLLPFTIEYDSNGIIQAAVIRSLDILWLIITILSYFLSSMLSLKLYNEYPKISNNTESLILIGGDNFILIFGLLFGIVIIIMDLCNRSKLLDILKNIHTFDETVCP